MTFNEKVQTATHIRWNCDGVWSTLYKIKFRDWYDQMLYVTHENREYRYSFNGLEFNLAVQFVRVRKSK